MTSFRIIVTGSRDWSWDNCGPIYDQLKRAVLDFSNPTDLTIVHGDCIMGGADAIAKHWCHYSGSRHEPHPAEWFKYGKDAGPIRNQHMVDLGADLVLAFPQGGSTGTRDCVQRARAAGIPVRVFPWPGKVEVPEWE